MQVELEEAERGVEVATVEGEAGVWVRWTSSARVGFSRALSHASQPGADAARAQAAQGSCDRQAAEELTDVLPGSPV